MLFNHVMLLCCQMLWFYHLSVTGPSKRSSRRETRWHSRTSNHSSPPSIIRHPPTHRSPDPCRPAGTVTVDRLNPCMTHPCSCPRRCGGGPPAPRTWVWRTRPPLPVRLEDSSKVCSDAKVSLYLLRYISKCLYFHSHFTVSNFKVSFESKMHLSETAYSLSLSMYMYMSYL